MKSIYTPKIILPDSLTSDEKIRALIAALNEQLKLISESVKQTLHIPRLDELSGEILNILAEQLHIDFFDTSLSDSRKRKLIRNSILRHRRLGTGWALLQVLEEFFEEPTILRTGDYRFRIKSKGYTGTPEEEQTFWRKFEHAKNVRSWLDYLNFDFSPEEATQIKVGSAIAVAGAVNIWPARIPDLTQKLYVGNALQLQADMTIAPAYPPENHKVIVHAGHALLIVGSITIANADEPTLRPTKENPNADLLIADIGIPR